MRGVSINAPPSAGWKLAGRDLHLPLCSTLVCCRQLKLAPGVANVSQVPLFGIDAVFWSWGTGENSDSWTARRRFSDAAVWLQPFSSVEDQCTSDEVINLPHNEP